MTEKDRGIQETRDGVYNPPHDHDARLEYEAGRAIVTEENQRREYWQSVENAAASHGGQSNHEQRHETPSSTSSHDGGSIRNVRPGQPVSRISAHTDRMAYFHWTGLVYFAVPGLIIAAVTAGALEMILKIILGSASIFGPLFLILWPAASIAVGMAYHRIERFPLISAVVLSLAAAIAGFVGSGGFGSTIDAYTPAGMAGGATALVSWLLIRTYDNHVSNHTTFNAHYDD